MQQFKLIATLVAIAIGTGGCFVAIGNSGHSRQHETDCGVVSDDGTVTAEINAAASLFSDSDKTEVLKDIARRPNLGGKAQGYLVKSAVRNIFSDSSKEEVLIALIENPCFNDGGKRAVLSNLNHIFSESRKKRILKAISSRQMQPLPVQVEATVEVTAETSVN